MTTYAFDITTDGSKWFLSVDGMHRLTTFSYERASRSVLEFIINGGRFGRGVVA